MRPAHGVHIEWVDDEAVVLDPQTKQIHYLNPSAALVYALMLEHGPEEGLAELRSRLGESLVEEELQSLLTDLHRKGLLVDD